MMDQELQLYTRDTSIYFVSCFYHHIPQSSRIRNHRHKQRGHKQESIGHDRAGLSR